MSVEFFLTSLIVVLLPGTGVLYTLAVNFFNPKLTLFFFAFLPQFIPSNTGNPTTVPPTLALTFMLITFVIFVGYGACASYAREYVISRPVFIRWLKRCFAGAFGLLALRLAFAER